MTDDIHTIEMPAGRTGLRRGLAEGVPIAVGYMPVAVAFGLLAGTTGLTLLESFLMSFLVFAGAAQYMALSMIASGSGIVAIIMATFIVNVRHLLMSASVASRLEETPTFVKVIMAYFMTDEVFAVSSTVKDPIKGSHVAGIGLVAFLSWTGFTVAGYMAGSVIPEILQNSLGFALYALFIALLIPSVRDTGRTAVILAVMGGLFHLLFRMVVETGWAIMLATILAVVSYELMERMIRWRHQS
ncbi:AzlC family ABC transporter permease [Salisediminibacterium beveridgei]|uniref:4-azaleucine resistance transporter AzlC n=1 Tax=Salisediminibacterium beveridgei TaxID=632773 RepID=A0A1D7QWM0_9BACI|nr:AzlC family ABC transporter permease [Salisediminibacterium beveridgei]AOM83400.1 hypothetical protein BBEV_2040 [Salisediminibacterium beveridgei]